ncbi:MAG: citramalate synthase [SAR202 cluster bacterium]|jgi:hydroxymethylglutaryl-CoA lyase|uniref:Pyruvate carboxyltransferase domain-containing protein n=1 Tax=marine metagenome TaxID=408172 RepID=A0A381Q8Y4_9ZZZZ|nr:citramalate synthase [Dehalococcoidia bacterium]MEC9237335.1 citramalate synthase [Chloroflexota bacterium]MQG13707.1 citramalate synthase [SAR202 cluster bacterium]MEC9289958.1 citramalate synthase [Chloroflexota bacterium]MQG31972.1 citramalate synthase [SAR202 cluster bacterium]|tara:strand:+ start:288 stop:1472 length:1185 start_codon:yes stop_codon:yes gene_type:complete
MADWPKVKYKEEGMREGMQIEDAQISVDDKVELLDMLSETGLQQIVVGSFVSPKWTPQMERIDEIVTKFKPKPGVTYTALALNSRGVERAKAYSPPLTIERDAFPRLNVHMCDVFVRRNTNRTQMQEMERWPQVIAQAQELNIKEAGIGTNASWGSNFLGEFPVDNLMKMLERQHSMWDEVGIDVRSASMGDPMSHCTPAKVEESVYRVKETWPEINHIRLHLHNGRNMAIASAYAAMRVLGPDDTLEIDGTIGGFGGCPYCGNGRATGMAPTEDLLHMMDDMGIPTGVDIDKLVECVWAAEKIMGRELYGHVSKAGPRPKTLDRLYDIDMPFVETTEQAKHFKVGPGAYEGGIYPYSEPITSPYRDRVDAGGPAYDDANGDFPWKQDWFPAKG